MSYLTSGPPIGGPGIGLFPASAKVKVTSTPGLAIGAVGMFNFGAASVEPGEDDSVFATVIAPVDTGAEYSWGLFCLGTETIAATGQGLVAIQGIHSANMDTTGSIGDHCSVLTVTLDRSPTATDKIVAIALATTNPSNVVFDGIHGFGVA